MHSENIIRQKKFIHLSQLQQLIFKCEASNEKFLSPDACQKRLSVDSHHTPSKRFRYTPFFTRVAVVAPRTTASDNTVSAVYTFPNPFARVATQSRQAIFIKDSARLQHTLPWRRRYCRSYRVGTSYLQRFQIELSAYKVLGTCAWRMDHSIDSRLAPACNCSCRTPRPSPWVSTLPAISDQSYSSSGVSADRDHRHADVANIPTLYPNKVQKPISCYQLNGRRKLWRYKRTKELTNTAECFTVSHG